MVAAARATAAAVLVLLGGCASSSTCPSDSAAYGITLPSGLGITVGESGLRAAFASIRDYFDRNPATGQGNMSRAADLAAEAAAENAAAPMSEEQRRVLREQTGGWVESYAEKCRPGS
jgi:hypothetical protein